MEDGSHICVGETYAEIEVNLTSLRPRSSFSQRAVFIARRGLQVMKMVMTLDAQQSGCIYFVKRPGAVLKSGCIVAHMELDDPSSVHRVIKEKNIAMFLFLFSLHVTHAVLL